MTYEAVIGLEVHVQVKTRSKIFTRVTAGYGHEPNTLTDPVVLALPGTLPVMNKAALDAIIKAGLLLGCEIAPVCKWDRKNYFYPDSPKNYQISQYDQPICLGGSVEIELPGVARNVMGEHKKIPLTRIHLEEDVGKLNHGASDSLVDYNRAGTPLMEIVSVPAMHTADEAYAYLTSLRATMIYGGISDCDMEKGQLRCDANISIRSAGETKLGVKVELKNLNSISFVRDGIAHEIKRQIAVLERGGTIVQETRDYDGMTGTSQSLRSKEMAHDYRYFPDPDLLPLEFDQAYVDALAAGLPELPDAKKARFIKDFGLSAYDAGVLVAERASADYFEAVARGRDGKAAANWVINELFGRLNKEGRSIEDTPVSAEQLGGIVDLIGEGVISGKIAKDLFEIVWSEGGDPREIVEARGMKQVTDTGAIEAAVDAIIAANPDKVEQAKAKPTLLGWFVGQTMKATGGKANPAAVNALLKDKLGIE
jgi:aspartyl-tRNA(Asn)/glutamyl-tRNA(Gln) amidotransferase subunit B